METMPKPPVELGSRWKRRTDEFTKIVQVVSVRYANVYPVCDDRSQYPREPWITVMVVEGVCEGRDFVYSLSEFHALYEYWPERKINIRFSHLTQNDLRKLDAIVDRVKLMDRNDTRGLELFITMAGNSIKLGVQSFKGGLVDIEHQVTGEFLSKVIDELNDYLKGRSK